MRLELAAGGIGAVFRLLQPRRQIQDCSAFTRVAACTPALSPIRDTLIEGFSHFVTSMTAPMLPAGALAGWGLHHWKAPPCHGAHPNQTSAPSTPSSCFIRSSAFVAERPIVAAPYSFRSRGPRTCLCCSGAILSAWVDPVSHNRAVHHHRDHDGTVGPHAEIGAPLR